MWSVQVGPRRGGSHRPASLCVTMHAMSTPPTGSDPDPSVGERVRRMLPVRPGVLGTLAGVVVLVIILCCVGGILLISGDDEPDESATSPSPLPTSTTSTTTQPSSSTTRPSSTTSSTTRPSSTTSSTTSTSTGPATSSLSSTASEPVGVAEVDFPDGFDGWTKSDSATKTSAIYRKGDDVLSAVAISGSQVDAYYERIWSDTSKHGDVVCGKLSTSANYQCAGAAEDGAGVLVSGSAETAEETASVLAGLLAAI